MASFICSSEKLGTPLPTDIELIKVSNECPVGYTQHSKENFSVHVPKSNTYNILKEQFKIYERQQKFTEDLSGTPGLIMTNPEQYRYRIQATARQVIISAQPKSFKDPSDWTYLAITEVEDSKIKNSFTRYCESEIPNIPIPNIPDIAKLSKDCPTGYKRQ